MKKRATAISFSKTGLALLTMLTLGIFNLFAQGVSGDVTGVITDATGGTVSGATVTAENQATNVKTTAKSSSAGAYVLRNLPVGDYTVTATASGFAPSSVRDLRVQLNNTVTANLSLQVGATTTTVEVVDAPPPIDTTTAQLQTTFEKEQATELPSAGLSRTIGAAGIWNMGLIGAGVSSQGGVGQGTGPSVAGQRPENNSFNLDGVSNNNHFSTGPLVYVSNEAVSEVSVLQNQFSPEFGGASGGIFNALVKSGTNQVHGNIYEYMQNRNLNAVDSTNAVQGLTSNPRFDSNRLGATIGGPVLKNKLFYFGNFEYLPLGQSSVPGAPLSAPTAGGFTALGNLAGVSKTNLGVLQKYLPTAPSQSDTLTVLGTKIPIGDISVVSPNFSNTYNAIVSVDYNLSDKDEFRGRYIYNKISQLDFNAQLPVFYGPAPTNNNFGSLTEFHNFSPTLQNEFRASFSRNNAALSVPDIVFPGLTVFPNISIDELNVNIGPDGPGGQIQNLLQLNDNVSKVWGRHTLKAGYHFTDVILTSYFIQRVRGDYDYSTLERYLLDQVPDGGAIAGVAGERSAGPSAVPAGFLQNEAFLADDFRVRSNLTLNLGIRYEYVTVPIGSRAQALSSAASVPGGITFAEPRPNPNEWSPRIGFAYTPGTSGVWSIRGGVSRAFDLPYGNLTVNAAPPFYQTTQDVDPQSTATGFLAKGGLTGGSPGLPTTTAGARAIVASYTFGNQRPYGMSWNLGVQRSFMHSYTLEVRYVGTKGVHLWNQDRLNIVPQVNANNFIPTFFSLPSAATFASLGRTLGQVKSFIVPGGTAARPFDQLASLGFANNITGYAPQGYSSYNGLAIQLTRRLANNFSYVAAFTWSHLLDDATATNFSTVLSPRRAQDFQNLRTEWASSALDRRVRFTFTPLYTWNGFKSGNWVMHNVVGNWRIAGTYTFESPEYATVQSGVDSNLNGGDSLDRTIINTVGRANTGSAVTGYNAAGQAVAANSAGIVAYVANNPNARFVVAGVGALANAGRNDFPLGRTNNIDLSLTKRFTIREGKTIEFGAQAFNLFNHAQYTGGFLSDVNPVVLQSNRNDLIPSNKLFGRFDQIYSSNSRQLQLVGRFTF